MKKNTNKNNKLKNGSILDVENFIQYYLFHPEAGYYTEPRGFLGQTGDFITAPQISSLFSQILALASVFYWSSSANDPLPITVIELGGGEGRMMEDMLKAWQHFPDFYHSLKKIIFVERSAFYQKEQKKRLALYNNHIHYEWIKSLENYTSLEGNYFFLVLGNEFLDALPIQQYIWQQEQWHQRHVRYQDKQWNFLDHGPQLIQEVSFEAVKCIKKLNTLLEYHPGLALLIDYGDNIPSPHRFGNTLQAVYHHQKVSPFDYVGQADLSHHVDFAHLRSLISPILHSEILSQASFLSKFGIMERLKELEKKVDPLAFQKAQLSVLRLISPTEMGELFKVLQISSMKK